MRINIPQLTQTLLSLQAFVATPQLKIVVAGAVAMESKALRKSRYTTSACNPNELKMLLKNTSNCWRVRKNPN